jgi:segregation and condensation protein A
MELPNLNEKIGQEQIQNLLFGEKLSWQAIIYDLINTEQLDPWDIDIMLLTNKYLEKIKEIEEANFFVSSKVLLAASLLLRIKSEILLNQHMKSLDDILFGKEEEKRYEQERIELDESIPGLIPRTPLPRSKKVSLQELLAALGKAISTENRRIGKVIIQKRREQEISISIPKKNFNIQDKIKEIYSKITDLFKQKEGRIAFSELHDKTNSEKIATFVPLLHLDYQQKLWLEQEEHFQEIWIIAKEVYERNRISEKLIEGLEEGKSLEELNEIEEETKESL